MADVSTCARCKRPVPVQLPAEGVRQTIGLRRELVIWRLRLSRWRFRWLPDDPADRVSGHYATLPLCDWCAGDVFLFAQGLPPRPDEHRRRTESAR